MTIISPGTPETLDDSTAAITRRVLVLAFPGHGSFPTGRERHDDPTWPRRNSLRDAGTAEGRHRAPTPNSTPSTLIREVLGGWGTTMRASIVLTVLMTGAAFLLYIGFGAGGLAPLGVLMIAHHSMSRRRSTAEPRTATAEVVAATKPSDAGDEE